MLFSLIIDITILLLLYTCYYRDTGGRTRREVEELRRVAGQRAKSLKGNSEARTLKVTGDKEDSEKND